jgi:hypothetical protein
VELIDRILAFMQADDIPFSVFMDLSKAFDTLDHNILLKKLAFYGLDDTSLLLFNSYLSNRYQYVTLEGHESQMSSIKTGVPQGSILGPLLFIVYINDIAKASNFFNTISYADDTTLTGSFNSLKCKPELYSDNINSELALVSDWLLANKLSLNIGKTKFMVFHQPQKIVQPITLSINGIQLDRVDSFTFLGLTIDERVN